MLNIIERLDRKQFSASVCVMKRGGELDNEVAKMGVELLEAPFVVPVQPYHTLLYRSWKAAQVFRPYRFSLWHSFNYSDDYSEPIIARLAGARSWFYTKKNMAWGTRAWTARTWLARTVVAQNTSMREFFFSDCPDKVRVIPPGVSTKEFRPGSADIELRRSWGFPEQTVVLGHLANILPVKNQLHLIRALSMTKENVGLVLAGAVLDSDYYVELNELITHLNLQHRVRLLGKVHGTAGFLRALDMFAFCSHHEACPVAVLEAMACGLPCVVTDIAAMQDIHKPNETALVVKSGDVTALSYAIDDLARSPELRRALGLAARLRVEQNFDVEQEAVNYQNLYHDFTARKAS